MNDALLAKTISAAAAAALVKSRDWVDYGGCLQAPVEFDRALALVLHDHPAPLREYRDLSRWFLFQYRDRSLSARAHGTV